MVSSRKLEHWTYDSVAFRFIPANDHTDPDSIATFRRRFLLQIEALFVQVLLLAHEMGVLKPGTVGLDMGAAEGEVADLMAKARRRIGRTSLTRCRSPTSWRVLRHDCPGWPRHARRM
jgi:hypothetical protein